MIGTMATEEVARIRVRGLVQGVGFRPTVWRLAERHALTGWVANDNEGVLIVARGTHAALDAFILAIAEEAPPLARIDRIEREAGDLADSVTRFVIAPSAPGPGLTGIVADAATCAECLREVNDPAARRFRYPFANCTHCGPRLSIVLSIPYDRVNTTMRAFRMCAACEREYLDPADRRFHAQPIACPDCGPRIWLARPDGTRVEPETLGARDPIAAAAGLLQRGEIVAIKGIGGFQLACDAFDHDAVTKLRRLKQREAKPFALMARDVATVREHCAVSAAEAALLQSSEAPIVVLDRRDDGRLASAIAPGIRTLGVMLPNTPLHHLLLAGIERKLLVLTSGNLSDEPQCIGNEEAIERLGHIASHFLLHDRDIARRVDDSLRRVVNDRPGLLRGARGVAPASIKLPPGFGAAPTVLAAGGELKNTFCLLRAREGNAEAIVSHHMGDLENAATHADYTRSLTDYLDLFEHAPSRVAIDLHPGYLSSQWGAAFASEHGLPLEAVQHHHAHVAACLADNGVLLDHPRVLGVVLDGSGVGEDGTLWGGEFLWADYARSTRLASFRPLPLLGGSQAVRQPWRSAYAHLVAAVGWERLSTEFGVLEIVRDLSARPRAVLDAMLAQDINSPMASSCGRLFDAVAAAVGVCRDAVAYEGQAAIELEALVDRDAMRGAADGDAYPFAWALRSRDGLLLLDPAPMWPALLADLSRACSGSDIASRFHRSLALAVVQTVQRLRADGPVFDTVVLSGGVMQNRVLLETLVRQLDLAGLNALTHRQVPAHDGGLALGQAVVAAARAMATHTRA